MPTTSVVTPWRILLSASGFRGRVKSEWVWMSMKPGATICPEASISRCASRSAQSPTAVMRPFLMATSARRAGVPFPSITCPPRINRSSIHYSSISGPVASESAASNGPANGSWTRRGTVRRHGVSLRQNCLALHGLNAQYEVAHWSLPYHLSNQVAPWLGVRQHHRAALCPSDTGQAVTRQQTRT